MSGQLRTILQQRLLISKIIWIALAFNILLLGLFLWQNPSYEPFDFQKIPELLVQPERRLWLAVAAVLGLLSWQVPQWFLKKSYKRPNTKEAVLEKLRNFRGQNGQRLWTDEQMAILESLGFEDLILVDAFSSWVLSFILAMAFADAISILGYVNSSMTREPSLFIPFAALSAVLFLLRFPTADSYVANIKRLSH